MANSISGMNISILNHIGNVTRKPIGSPKTKQSSFRV